MTTEIESVFFLPQWDHVLKIYSSTMNWKKKKKSKVVKKKKKPTKCSNTLKKRQYLGNYL